MRTTLTIVFYYTRTHVCNYEQTLTNNDSLVNKINHYVHLLYLLEILSEELPYLLRLTRVCKCMNTLYAKKEDLRLVWSKISTRSQIVPLYRFNTNRKRTKLLDRDSKLVISHPLSCECSNRSSCSRLVFVWPGSFSLSLLLKMAAICSIMKQWLWLR